MDLKILDFKLVSKKNLGVITCLILIILLSQAKTFVFLLDTILGRTLLILCILGISYTNQILGIVSVLFVIIAINNSNMGYMEGFHDKSEHQVKNVDLVEKESLEHKSEEEEPKEEKPASLEGFNITDKEDAILRGKQSNQVPVFSSFHNNSSDSVEPSDKSIFTNLYSTFL